MMLDDDELLRYSRQILMPQFGVEGQLALKKAQVLVVGLGGLGSPVALYLAAAGCGRLVLADGDRVDLSNLQRQIVHDGNTLGENKARSAAKRLRQLNPRVQLQLCETFLQGQLLDAQVGAADVVVDCSDRFSTRDALNRACLAARVPLVSGAAIRAEGQLAVFDFRRDGGPCYRCLYPDLSQVSESCNEAGVLGPLLGVMGSLQAMEVIRLLAGLGRSEGQLLSYSAIEGEFRRFSLTADPDCPVCGTSNIGHCAD